MAQTTKIYRDTFKLFDSNVLRWFPGHMDRGLKQMQSKLIHMDCIIEVHDSRIPFSGRNPIFQSSITAIKPHILVLNKRDLCDGMLQPKIMQRIKEESNIKNILFTNCKNQNCSGLKAIFPLAEDLIKRSDRYHRNQSREHNIMIIGIPNVGKSSLLNTMRNRYLSKPNASPVGGVPGITRSVLNRIKISEDPPVYVLDTPGILWPNIPDIETGLKMALCNILQDHLVGEDVIADYLLFWMNQRKKFSYVEYMGLDEPTDEISEVLTKGAVYLNKYKKIKTSEGYKTYPDFILAAKHLLDGFRKGALGKFVLDYV